MVQTSIGEVQTALYNKLTGDATLMVLLTGVFDFGAVPTNQPFAYVTIGDATESPLNTFGRRGYSTRHLIHIWDNSPGFAKCQSILARINFLIDQKPLTLATQSLVYLLYKGSHPLNDPGLDSIRHYVCEYEHFTQE